MSFKARPGLARAGVGGRDGGGGGGAGDARDRSDPFAQLESSHQRLQEYLHDLLAAARSLADDPGNGEARNTVVEVSAFIDRAVARHERDEEESLFPRLSGVVALTPRLAALCIEHREHEQLHDELRMLAGLCERVLTLPEAARLADVTLALTEAYSRHIEAEELEIFPAARATLGADAIAAVAAEMQARRGR